MVQFIPPQYNFWSVNLPTNNTLRAAGGINCLDYILPITSIMKLQVALFPDWSTAEYVTV